MRASLNPPPWLADILALFGGVLYLALSWYFAHTQASVLDEGLYLYKGWLYASGRYTLFQDYGPWSNHMPLSFLVPGWVQLVFGAGLRTGRMLAVATGLLSLLAVGLLARRLAGRWWGAFAVWAVALNPALVKVFSVQASQGLAACILAWSLFMAIGRERRPWQLALASALAAALALTRINLLPVLPLMVAYAYWVHGRRAGHAALASGGLVFLVGHAFFWPGILRLWTPWLPEGLTPFLDVFRGPPNEGGLWSPEVDLSSRVFSLLQGMRFHFVALLSALGVLLALPWRGALQGGSLFRRRTALFLLGFFGLLAAMHAWASLGKDYCVFCFPVYLSFFSLAGLLLLPAAWQALDWNRVSGRWPAAAAVLLFTAAGFGAFDTVGASMLDQRGIVQLMKLEVPRTSGPGTIPLWGLLENRFGLDYETSVRQGLLWGRMGVSALLGAGVGVAVLAVSRALGAWRAPLQLKTYAALLAAALLLSPTPLLGGGYRTYDCGGDVIAAYEKAGARLSQVVGPGDRVYWGTGTSPVPLLYLPEALVYPAQLNGAYSFKFGGDPDALSRFGHWNRALAERWAAEADILLLSPSMYRDADSAWLVSLVGDAGHTELEPTRPVHPCDSGSQILIFVRE